MSLVRTLRRFIGTRAASTVTAAQATPVAPSAPAPEAAPSIEELRQHAKRVYKEVSGFSGNLGVQQMLLAAVEPCPARHDPSSTPVTSLSRS